MILTRSILNNWSQTNYVRKALRDNNYWVDFSREKLNTYKNTFGENFSLIVYSEYNTDCDYYVIPYSIVKSVLTENNLSTSTSGRDNARWIITIKNHKFKATGLSAVDVKDYFTNPYSIFIDGNEQTNDFQVEDRKLEIKVRQKQSVFRDRVLTNFSNTCCVSGLTEVDLLVASHIVPWAHNKDIRIDPANGLCLFALYDKLFDLGYFTINDDLSIRTISITNFISDSLRDILLNISGQRIRQPIIPIRLDFLAYHRDNIFIERS